MTSAYKAQKKQFIDDWLKRNRVDLTKPAGRAIKKKMQAMDYATLTTLTTKNWKGI